MVRGKRAASLGRSADSALGASGGSTGAGWAGATGDSLAASGLGGTAGGQDNKDSPAKTTKIRSSPVKKSAARRRSLDTSHAVGYSNKATVCRGISPARAKPARNVPPLADLHLVRNEGAEGAPTATATAPTSHV